MQVPLPGWLDQLRRRIARIDGAVRPIARRSLDFNDSNWLQNLRGGPDPLDQAGVKAEAEALLRVLIEAYALVDEETRASVRELLAHYSSFAWAATLPLREGDPANIRQQFIHFSMLDQGFDARDAVLWLHELCSRSGLAPQELASIRHEVAGMSSTIDRYGFGSTATMLREADKGV